MWQRFYLQWCVLLKSFSADFYGESSQVNNKGRHHHSRVKFFFCWSSVPNLEIKWKKIKKKCYREEVIRKWWSMRICQFLSIIESFYSSCKFLSQEMRDFGVTIVIIGVWESFKFPTKMLKSKPPFPNQFQCSCKWSATIFLLKLIDLKNSQIILIPF